MNAAKKLTCFFAGPAISPDLIAPCSDPAVLEQSHSGVAVLCSNKITQARVIQVLEHVDVASFFFSSRTKTVFDRGMLPAKNQIAGNHGVLGIGAIDQFPVRADPEFTA